MRILCLLFSILWLIISPGCIKNDKHNPAVETRPALIAFNSERDGNSEIYIMKTDGSEPRRLTNNPAYDAWPVWSPDGSQLAFTSNRMGNPDIFIMNADGGGLRQVTHDPERDIWPDWSPDGEWIVFVSRRDNNFEIYTVRVDGTDLRRLTDTAAHEDFPTWSPDGTRIVFSRTEGDDGTYIMNADGSNQVKLAGFEGLEFSWSPDGKRIAFGSDHEG
ncbi:MAG: PD40 domain-containing protein, partial [Candidatus Cloacimonetes bacterium]|nr:PD40 domain-containing protein [Candidatus Cloacimonadota bacterium]